MGKIGRNELCPCGSGKKYKKCCGKVASLSAFREHIVDQEVEQLLDKMYDWFIRQWGEKIPNLLVDQLGDSIEKVSWLNDFSESDLTESEEDDMTLLIDCLLYDYPFLEGETILYKYFQKVKNSLRSSVIEVFTHWMNSYVSIYEIEEVSLTEERAILRDFFSDSKFQVDTSDLPIDDEVIGNIIVTRLLSKGSNYFASGFVLLNINLIEYLIQEIEMIKEEKMPDMIWNDFLKKYGYELYITASTLLEQSFEIPNIEEFSNEMIEQFGFHSEKQKEVARMIIDNFIEEFSSDEVIGALLLWREYCEIFEPRIKKTEVMVATLEYVVKLGSGHHVTQSEIARKYNVTAGTISSRYREFFAIMQALFEEEFDLEDTFDKN